MSETWDGRPQNPERDGWHWGVYLGVDAEPFWWDADKQRWADTNGMSGLNARRMRYLGPCLTPAEVAAAVAAEREACARTAMIEVGWNTGTKEARKAIAFQAAHAVNAIRARGTSGADALAEVRRQVKRECAARYRQMQEEQRASLVAHGEYGSDARDRFEAWLEADDAAG